MRTSNETGPAPAQTRSRTAHDRLAGLRLGLGEDLADRAADDHLDQLVRPGVGDLLLADQPAVAQHGDAIGDAEDLVEAMRDIDHADAALP